MSSHHLPVTNNTLSLIRENPAKSVVSYFGWQKKAKNGAVWDKFGVFLDNFGVIWAQFGVVLDYYGNKKTPKNRVFGIENNENIQFSCLISSKRLLPIA